ncbi:MAG: DUF4197 domain-containing protein, partial [Candidatus Rokuibacteriota bacterium]
MRLGLLAVVMVLVGASAACAQIDLDRLLKGLPQAPSGGSIGDVKIGQALKEALQVGTEKAVRLTGRADGYYLNQAIKILLPDNLKTVESGLRMVGYGAEVDALVLGMNRAAERAAPAAKAIFWDAIGDMTIDDARRILNGADTAATDYFRDKTTRTLTAAFRPVVERSMNEVGVTRQYKQVLGQAKGLPFLNVEDYDIDRYVVGKALTGLF